MMRALVLLSMALVIGCPREATTTTTNDAQLLQHTLAALQGRMDAVRDLEVEGEIRDAQGARLGFSYAQQQPGKIEGVLRDGNNNKARAFVFDGEVLAIVDVGTETVVKKNLAGDEEGTLLLLHEVFSQFVCEGWRPPLIKQSGTHAVAQGDDVLLTVAIGDSGLKEQQVRLKKSGAFLSKQTVRDDGSVAASTVVLDTATDAGTGLEFPTSWRVQEGTETGTVTLSSWRVNQGVHADRFSTKTPPGYTERAQ